ncbi:hypothetical protein ACFLRC_03580 [Candidatus Altiarchaeota archaeon]
MVERVDQTFLSVEGPNVKRTKINYQHVEPLPVVLEFKGKPSSKTITSALEKEGLKDK